MRSQRKEDRLDVHQLGPDRLLTSILLVTHLVLPALTLDTLLCYHCPLQPKGKPCTAITSQCLPDQHCSSSRGRYGPIHVLSAQGCVDRDLCGSHEIISYKGVEYNVSHSCCCKDKCNDPPKADTSLKTLLGIVKEETDINDALKWDSCANYTSLRTSTSTATE